MISQFTLTSTAWTAISTAGQSGSCWLDEDGDGSTGSMNVRVTHAASLPATSEFTKAKRVYKPSGNADVLILTADGTTDIFYAMCKDGTAIISADMV
jgi:hypothetical protein